MRAIISPSGSFNAIVRPSLPARLHKTGDQALGAELPERDTAELVLAVNAARPSRHFATVANARCRRITRQLGELERRGEPLLHRLLLVARDRLETRAAPRQPLRQPAAPVVLLNRTLLRHLALLTFRV